MDITLIGIIIGIFGIIVSLILCLKKSYSIKQKQKNTENSNQKINIG